MKHRLIANANNGPIPVERPLESFRNVDAESQRIMDLWNKHFRRLADCNGQLPFQAELPSLWIKVHEDWNSTDSLGVDPGKCLHYIPVDFPCVCKDITDLI